MSAARVRPYEPRDRDAVRRICFKTGFMGAPIAGQYADFESFADMFTSYFTDVEPENAFVAVMNGEVVGYSISALDARKVWLPHLIAIRHALTRAACVRPGTFGLYVRSALDMLSDLGRGRPKFDWNLYPSTSHVDLLPEGRGGTLGRDLMYSAFDRLKQAGSPGVHGETLSLNTRAVAFFEKTLGLTMLDKPYPVPGLRAPDGSRMSWVLGCRSFQDWEVGAWKPSDAAHAD